MTDIEAPDGTIIEFPDGMSEAAMLEAMRKEYGGPAEQQAAPEPAQGGGAAQWLGEAARGFQGGLEQGLTFGGADEAKAGLATALTKAAGSINPAWGSGNDWPTEYQTLLSTIRAGDKQATDAAPVASILGTLAGGAALGGAGAGLAKGMPLARIAARNPKTAASALGGISGGLYAFGTGEGSGQERLSGAGLPAMLGAALGPVGVAAAEKIGPAVGSLAEKARRIFSRPKVQPAAQADDLATLVERQRTALEAPSTDVAGMSGQESALRLVTDRLKRDYPDNWQQVLEAWKNGDAPIADIAQRSTVKLAEDAAQYPRGRVIAQRYFDEATASSPERVIKDVGGETFYRDVEDVLAKGREAAKPLYDQAHSELVNLGTTKLKPEVTAAIKAARSKYPSDLEKLPDNSVKVLDYAKRELDDQISTAQRSGERNLARNRTGVKDELVKLLDDNSAAYKQARAVAGDYLSTERAMLDGQDIFKPATDSELLGKTIADFGKPQKEAFKEGVRKAIRDQLERVRDGANPYNSIMGTPDKRMKLMKVFNPEEYRTLEKSLKAEDRLFKMRNEVVKGSQTASRIMGAAQIASGGQEALMGLATGNPRGLGLSAIRGVLAKSFDGMNDRTAEYVARLIFETDPQKKVLLLDRMGKGGKAMTPADRQAVKQAYFAFEDLQRTRAAGATTAGQIGSDLARDDKPKDPLRITIRPSDKSRGQ